MRCRSCSWPAKSTLLEAPLPPSRPRPRPHPLRALPGPARRLRLALATLPAIAVRALRDSPMCPTCPAAVQHTCALRPRPVTGACAACRRGPRPRSLRTCRLKARARRRHRACAGRPGIAARARLVGLSSNTDRAATWQTCACPSTRQLPVSGGSGALLPHLTTSCATRRAIGARAKQDVHLSSGNLAVTQACSA
jgi:hypothetical protein